MDVWPDQPPPDRGPTASKPVVLAVSAEAGHDFSKWPRESIRLLEGLGVEGDAHAGATVQHHSRVAADPTQPNLRQVHLLQVEFHEEAGGHGHRIAAGDLGENVLTSGVDLLSLPRDTRLHLGAEAVVRVTGLRNPCRQIEAFHPGLLALATDRDEHGGLVRKSG